MPVTKTPDALLRVAFVSRILSSQAIWTVAGDEGLARVDSPRHAGRLVNLFWSDRAEAERWAHVLVTQPRLKLLSLFEMQTQVLPRLAEMRRLVGTDWTSEPIEPEFEPLDLDRMIRLHMLDVFLATALRQRHVWVLQGPDGPACFVSKHPKGGEALPVWIDRLSAEARLQGPWADFIITRVALAEFVQKTLIWCAETGRRVAPGYQDGPGVLEMAPWDLKARMKAIVARAEAHNAPASSPAAGPVTSQHKASAA
jgi:Protein of unknown function (DUF2750)